MTIKNKGDEKNRYRNSYSKSTHKSFDCETNLKSQIVKNIVFIAYISNTRM